MSASKILLALARFFALSAPSARRYSAPHLPQQARCSRLARERTPVAIDRPFWTRLARYFFHIHVTALAWRATEVAWDSLDVCHRLALVGLFLSSCAGPRDAKRTQRFDDRVRAHEIREALKALARDKGALRASLKRELAENEKRSRGLASEMAVLGEALSKASIELQSLLATLAWKAPNE